MKCVNAIMKGVTQTSPGEGSRVHFIWHDLSLDVRPLGPRV